MIRLSLRRYITLIFCLFVLQMIIIYINMNISEMSLASNLAQKWKKSSLKKDWHDYRVMYNDLRRSGLGERGKSAALNDSEFKRNLEKEMWTKYGFNALLSDTISINRSVTDLREKGCHHKKYLAQLPAVSVVIPFHNELFSVLLRTLYSLLNRTPSVLLKEIILVDDFSNKTQHQQLGQQLDQYVAQHFQNVQIVRLPERMGLIRARLVGMRKATATVLVILDSHVEVGYNWLPPLLEPIVLNKRAVVCPIIDHISFRNFEIHASAPQRGAFEWNFLYVLLPILPEDAIDATLPYKNIIMNGGLFAINAEFFWELGGYDEELDVRGGEQYELSFKIWMCGGILLDAPCSRVAHLYRDAHFVMPNPRKYYYIYRNFKRVAEVWMDEYKVHLFKYRPDSEFHKTDPGNLTVPKQLRQKCKSFKWFLENVAYDLLKFYPPIEPPDYASGAIQNVKYPNYCLQVQSNDAAVKVVKCSHNLVSAEYKNQNFALTWRHDVRIRKHAYCLDVKSPNHVWIWGCHGMQGNQFWYYDRANKWLIHGRNGKRCLEIAADEHRVYVNKCQKDNAKMQWNFEFVNNTALDRFFENV